MKSYLSFLLVFLNFGVASAASDLQFNVTDGDLFSGYIVDRTKDQDSIGDAERLYKALDVKETNFESEHRCPLDYPNCPKPSVLLIKQIDFLICIQILSTPKSFRCDFEIYPFSRVLLPLTIPLSRDFSNAFMTDYYETKNGQLAIKRNRKGQAELVLRGLQSVALPQGDFLASFNNHAFLVQVSGESARELLALFPAPISFRQLDQSKYFSIFPNQIEEKVTITVIHNDKYNYGAYFETLDQSLSLLFSINEAAKILDSTGGPFVIQNKFINFVCSVDNCAITLGNNNLTVQ